MNITLSHPHGNPNSYHAARALAEKRWLNYFHTGIISKGVLSALADYLPASSKNRLVNRKYNNIPVQQQYSHFLPEVASRIGGVIKQAGVTSQINWYDVLYCTHDLQVSKILGKDLDAIYAYEDGAERTFKAAKQQKALKIYELPLGYYLGVGKELERAHKERPSLNHLSKTEPSWKQQRKDTELDLADVIVVPCRWAKQSLKHSKGHSRKPVLLIPYGTPAIETSSRTVQPEGAFTVLFAGQIGLRKGVPHLIEAWERLRLKNAKLLLAGSMRLGDDYLNRHGASFEYLGTMPRIDLLNVMKGAELFVFPSLAEGFGLVIGEAMAAGVPVLTTYNTGGTELITDGEEGWCVPAHDVEALSGRIEWAYHHRDELYEMGRKARYRAEQWTWADYRRELTDQLSQFFSAGVS